jgi:hypothetical protein
MTFRLSPMPHIHLAEATGATELSLNALTYAMTLGVTGSFVWLAMLAWLDRSK